MVSVLRESRQTRRSTVEMMCDILQVVGGGTEKPTHIAYRSNLSWAVLTRYLDFMVEQGLIEKKSGPRRSMYELTKKGRETLLLYKEVRLGLGVESEGESPFITGSREALRTVLFS